MSDEPTTPGGLRAFDSVGSIQVQATTATRADVPDEAAEAVSMDNGMLVVDLAGLPPGSLVTITVRVGPETPAPQPEPAPTKRYLGQGRINQGGA